MKKTSKFMSLVMAILMIGQILIPSTTAFASSEVLTSAAVTNGQEKIEKTEQIANTETNESVEIPVEEPQNNKSPTGESQNANDSPLEIEENLLQAIPKSELIQNDDSVLSPMDKFLQDNNLVQGKNGKLYLTIDESVLTGVDINSKINSLSIITPFARAANQIVVVPSWTNIGNIRVNYQNSSYEMFGWYGKRDTGGDVLWCIELGVALNLGNNGGYNTSELTTSLSKDLSLVAWFGYYQKGKTLRNEFMTQHVMYELMGNKPTRMVGDYSLADYTAFRNEVMAKVALFKTTPNFDKTGITLKPGQSVTVTDTTGAFAGYKATPISNTSGVKVSNKSGNKVTLTADSNSKNGNVFFGIDIDDNYKGATLLYSHQYTQNTIRARVSDPKEVKIPITIVKNGNVTVRKLDLADHNKVLQATYEATRLDTNEKKIIKTNSGGYADWYDLPAGITVRYVEVTAPDEYVRDSKPIDIVVKVGETVVVPHYNAKQTGTARLFKEDSKTGTVPFGDKYTLEGAVYGLFTEDDTKLQSVTLTKVAGKFQAEVSGLPLGNYYWLEEKAPNGYLINTAKVPFSLTYAGQDTAVTVKEAVAKDVAQLGKVTIIKQDTETGDTAQGEATLENAVYGLFQVDGTKIKSVTLKNVNGKVLAEVADLKLGDYYWQEEKAPEGYQLNTKKVPFSLTYAGESVTTALNATVATDDVMKGSFDLFKFGNYDWKTTLWNWVNGKDTSSEQKQGLEGVEFTVYQNFGLKKEVAKKVTPKSGYLVFTGLPYGTYRVSETKTPEGYKSIPDFYVTISEHGQTFHYSIENKVKEAQVKLFKVDSESGKAIPRPEAGFEFYSDTTGELLKMKDLTGKEQSVFFTNSEGELQIPTMFAYGNYRVKEVQAPKGYVIAKEEVKFSVTGDEKDGIVIIKFKNDNQKGQIKLHKNVQTATSLVTETTEYGELTKIDYTQQSGEGFKFKIKTKKDVITPEGTEKQKAGSFVQSGGSDLVLVTDKDGNVESLPILYIGSYELVEVEAPKGVVMLKEPQPFEIKYIGQAVDVTSTTVSVDNDIQTIDIVGYKSQEVVTGWENGQAIIDLEKATNGQVFALKNAEDQMIGVETLSANTTLGYAKVVEGELLFKDYHLPEGKYYLEETDAGEQHVLNPEKYEFEYVAEDNLDSQTIHVWADSTAVNKQGLTRIARTPIINELARAAVQLVKTDALDGKELENVLFDLVRIDGEGDEQTETIISKHATDVDGKILVENLPTGRYKLVETRPLDWYEDNKDSLDFTVTPENDGEIIELEAVNQRKPLEIETLFATTKDGNKQINPDIDHDLTDYGKVKGMKKDHTYYVDTFYMSATGEISKSEFEITGDGEAIQKFKTDLYLPKGTMKDGEILAAKHIIYSDKEKENEVGRHNEDLTDPNQMVEVKKPKVAIKTKAHTGDGKTQTFTHGDIIKAYDNVELTHKDILDGTKRSLKAILVAVIPGKGEKDIWESAKIDYVVKDADIVKQVMTEVDTSKYPESTTFYFKEIGYNEAGEEDMRHNFDGKDRDQSLTPKKVLPQTGEQTAYMFMLAGLVMVTMVVFSYRFKKEQEI